MNVTKDPISVEWTPIFNTTSDMIGPFSSENLPVFRLNYTQHKEPDKYLYHYVSVNLYNGDGTAIGHTSFIFYARNVSGTFQYTAYKRFYFDGPWSAQSCSQFVTMDYIQGYNFEMVTSVGSEDMFQFIGPDGETNTESMGECSSYSVWQDMVQEAESADLKVGTWVDDLTDYFTTEFNVLLT